LNCWQEPKVRCDFLPGPRIPPSLLLRNPIPPLPPLSPFPPRSRPPPMIGGAVVPGISKGIPGGFRGRSPDPRFVGACGARDPSARYANGVGARPRRLPPRQGRASLVPGERGIIRGLTHIPAFSSWEACPSGPAVRRGWGIRVGAGVMCG